jgi:negative regulator of flagellin synthesis FlgM
LSYLNGIGSSQPFSGVQENISSPSVVKLAKTDVDSTATVQQSKSSDSGTASLSSTGGVLASGLLGSDVRTDRVASLQQAIAAGTYHVSASDVAGKLMSALLN